LSKCKLSGCDFLTSQIMAFIRFVRPDTSYKRMVPYPRNRERRRGNVAMANFDFEATIASVAAVAVTGIYWATLIDVVVR
jgi:hypothetical protein